MAALQLQIPLKNKKLRDLYESVQPADKIFFDLLQQVEGLQDNFNETDYKEKMKRITDNRLPALTPDLLFLIKRNNLLDLNYHILETLSYMLTKNYNIEEAKKIFAKIIDDNMTILNIQNAPTGMAQVLYMIRQIPLDRAQRRVYEIPEERPVAQYAAQPVPQPARPGAAPLATRGAEPRRALREPVPIPDINKLTLEEKLKLLQSYIDRFACGICKTNEANTTLIPCGHIFCSECIQNAQKARPDCPICREVSININNLFLTKYLKYKNKYLKLKNVI